VTRPDRARRPESPLSPGYPFQRSPPPELPLRDDLDLGALRGVLAASLAPTRHGAQASRGYRIRAVRIADALIPKIAKVIDGEFKAIDGIGASTHRELVPDGCRELTRGVHESGENPCYQETGRALPSS
jgi:hypothetical protein